MRTCLTVYIEQKKVPDARILKTSVLILFLLHLHLELKLINLGRFGTTLPIAIFAYSLGSATRTDPNSVALHVYFAHGIVKSS